MNVYLVTLEWPRSSKQSAYCEEIQAVTQAEAKLKACASARNQGWKGSPTKQQAVILREVAA